MSAEDLSKLRGLLAGLVLGEACADAGGKVEGHLDGEGPLRIGVASQLACFGVDALIRADLREKERGFANRAMLSWFSLCRWGRLQGLPVAEDSQASSHSAPRYDNWLSRIEALTQRRGSAPATVTALTHRLGHDGINPAAISLGAHAIIRALPFAAAAAIPEGRGWFHEGRAVAAQTHAPAAADIAQLTARLAAAAWITGSVREGARLALAMGSDVRNILEQTLRTWSQDGSGTSPLAQLPALSTADFAFREGLLAALAPPPGSNMLDAFLIGAHARRPAAALSITGALIGAAYGIEALPQHLLARVEIADVVDDLAHDYAATLSITPPRRDLAHWYPTI